MTAPTKNVVDLTVAGSGTLVSTDKVLVVDVSDTTEGPLGTVKIATAATLSSLFATLSTAGLLSVNNNGLVHVNASGALTSATNATLTSTGLAVTGTLSATTSVGIGTTSNRASSLLDVRGNVTVGANANYYGTLSYNAGTGAFDSRSEDGVFTWTKAAGPSTIMATLDASNYFRLAAGGIQFNGDTAAANALDDYEEGTWTPIDASGAALSLTFTNARYTKIGNKVFITAGTIVYPSTANTMQARIGGLPFTNGAADTAGIVGVSTNANVIRTLVPAATTYMLLYSTSNTSSSTNTQVAATTYYGFAATYLVA